MIALFPFQHQLAVLRRHGLGAHGLTRGEASARIGKLAATWERTG